MTQIIFAVIDNHTKRKGTSYDIIFKSKKFNALLEFAKEKGLIQNE